MTMKAERTSSPPLLSTERLRQLTQVFDDGKPLYLGTMKRSLTQVASEPWHSDRDKAPLLLHRKLHTLCFDDWKTSDMTETKPGEVVAKEDEGKCDNREPCEELGQLSKELKQNDTYASDGGMPITLETALKLRKLVLGSTEHTFSHDWRCSVIDFYDLSGAFPYGLQTQRCGSRALSLCIQGYLLKHLIFTKECQSSHQAENCLQPGDYERKQALVTAMSEILWQAGDQKHASVCLSHDKRVLTPASVFKDDGITETIFVHVFRKFIDLEMFIKRNLTHFSNSNNGGCILLLYSVILSRRIERVQEDLDSQSDKLLMDNEDCTHALFNLLLTGQAVQSLHNGNKVYDSNGQLLAKSLRGVQERNHIGYLFWDKNEPDEYRTEVGSMLKVPKCPIWLTHVNHQVGLLFSTNLDLVRDWRTEHQFSLYYYTGLPNHRPTMLTIETRIGRQIKSQTEMAIKEELNRIPSLERCIMTKWYGAEVNWNGTLPFI